MTFRQLKAVSGSDISVAHQVALIDQAHQLARRIHRSAVINNRNRSTASSRIDTESAQKQAAQRHCLSAPLFDLHWTYTCNKIHNRTSRISGTCGLVLVISKSPGYWCLPYIDAERRGLFSCELSRAKGFISR